MCSDYRVDMKVMRTSLDRVVYGSIPRPTSLLWSTVRS
jgi:hypothetical protein